MRIRVALFAGLLSIAGSTALFAAGAAETYQEAAKAWASKDWSKTLPLLEQAAAAEPDSMKYLSEYRMAVMEWAKTTHPKEGAPADFDRGIKFFEKLTADNPKASVAFLNLGFAFVDKIPAAGSITQVLLANTALSHFTKSLEIKPSWIAYYTRGNSYLYWPRIFQRAHLGVADLEKAYEMQKKEPKRSYHVRVFISLGDGYWKTDQLDKAKALWKEGLAAFPDSQPLKDRLAREGDELKTYIDNVLDPNKRVDTNLKELWMVQQ